MSEQHNPSSPENSPDASGAAVTTDMLHVDRYEGAWMRLSFAVLVIFFVVLVFSSFSVGFQVPGVYQRIDPSTLQNPDSPFANPGLRELAPGKYEVYLRAQIWSFTPSEIRIPVGSTVTFYATSQDVQHGVRIAETNINMMILPGQISTLKTTFNKPGTYNFICHEYCGMLHHTMYGRIIIESGVATYAIPEWRPYLLELGLRITLLFISATLFFLIVFATVLLPGRKLTIPVEMPVAEPLSVEPAPAWLDHWWPWVNGAIALIIMSYGPMLYQLIRDAQSIPFMPRIW